MLKQKVDQKYSSLVSDSGEAVLKEQCIDFKGIGGQRCYIMFIVMCSVVFNYLKP